MCVGFEFISLCLVLQQTTFQRYFVAAVVVFILKVARKSMLFFVCLFFIDMSRLHLYTAIALNKETFLIQSIDILAL